MVSHPENATVHKLLDARSHKGCIVAGSSPVLTTKIKLWKKMNDVQIVVSVKTFIQIMIGVNLIDL